MQVLVALNNGDRRARQKMSENEKTDASTPVGAQRREDIVRSMGWKARRYMQHWNKREERTSETMNPIKTSFDDSTNVLKSFVALQNLQNVEEAR